MKIFLTGGSGFLGYCTAKALLKGKHEVRMLIRSSAEKEKFENMGFQTVIGDLENFQSAFLQDMDVVYHFAAIRYEWGFSWEEYEKTNINGTEKLLEAAVEKNIKRFIYCSTAFVHGYPKSLPTTENSPLAPSSLYAKSKLAAEKIVRKYSEEKGLFSIILRPSMVYGPEDANGMFMKLCRLIEKRKFMPIGNGENYVHLTYIDDIVQGFLQSLTQGKSGEAYILASPQPITQNSLVGQIEKNLKVKKRLFWIPFSLAKITGFLFEIGYAAGQKIKIKYFFQEPLVTRSKVDIIANSQYFEAKKAREELDFFPKINYNEGISKTIAWQKMNGYLKSR